MSDEDEDKSRKARRQEKIERATKMMDLTKNPCMKEQKLSLKCLNDNDYDKYKCKHFFDNYKQCGDFWNSVQSDRRRKGILPLLPPLEEREEVKAQFMAKKRAPPL